MESAPLNGDEILVRHKSAIGYSHYVVYWVGEWVLIGAGVFKTIMTDPDEWHPIPSGEDVSNG